jgi:cleavage stimulation factor subunit 3
MADDTAAELAFLNEMKESDPAANYSNGDAQEQPEDSFDPDEYDPAHLDTSFAVPDDQSPSEQSSASMMPDSAAQSPPTATDSSLKPPPAETAAAPTPTKQPRTMGGFVVESEDEEEDVPESKPAGSTLLQATAGGSSDTPQRSLSHTPNNTLPPSNVPLQNVQDQDDSGVSLSTGVPVNNIVTTVASAVPDAITPVSDSNRPAPLDNSVPVSARPSAAPTPITSSLPKPRLPQDRVGMLEDRIAEDPRGDMDAWLSLINEHRKRGKHAETRAVYDRFFKVFPTTAEEWVKYAKMEESLEAFQLMEQIFARSILNNPHVELLSTYLDYIRRRHNLTTDSTGDARKVITQAYEFVLLTVGIDFHSGKLWHDYIEFLKSGPGTVGGNNWQDMQKMDTLRKAYQRAIAIPTNATTEIWREYDKFEMGLNRTTGRKYLQEKSPLYMTARSAVTVLENITRDVNRTTYPKLPPKLGFDGFDEYKHQVMSWRKWIDWEKSDPLEDPALTKTRVLYIYKQALMPLRFWPRIWYEAAVYCFENDMAKEGLEFLTQGTAANPEDCLLAFKLADRIELTSEFEDGDPGAIRKGEAVREPFNKLLDSLYELVKKTNRRAEHAVAMVKENFAQQANEEPSEDEYVGGDDWDDDEKEQKEKEREQRLQRATDAIKAGYDEQLLELKKTISYAWIMLMRTMRRVQGKGQPYPTAGSPPGFRGIFIEARQKGHLLSDAYVASALIEHFCYQDPAAQKIFERGMKLFPEDENFAQEYINFLIMQNDATNARSVFETVVNRLTQKPENVHRTYHLFTTMHGYESRYGELAQIVKLEQRMNELFPDEPRINRFMSRYNTPKFDPCKVRPVISMTQMRPKPLEILPTVEQQPPSPPRPVERRPSPPPVIHSPPRQHPALLHISNSPKRPFDDGDNESAQPRKLMRGESPLKGAAGRRLVDAARRNHMRLDGGSNTGMGAPPPAPLPRDISFLLAIIPGAHTYHETRFNPEKMVQLLRTVDLSRAIPSQPQPPPQQSMPVAPPQPQMGGAVGGWPQPMGGMPQYNPGNQYYR